jgi:DNA-binding NarL/FixJ family response regulator
MKNTAPTRILLAIASPSLLRVIEHLLRELPGLEVAQASNAAAAARAAARLAPDVIVTSGCLLGRDGRESAAELRRLNPTAKLVFITEGDEWWLEVARRGWADASLDEEDLVRGLLPIVHTLAAGTRPVAVE